MGQVGINGMYHFLLQPYPAGVCTRAHKGLDPDMLPGPGPSCLVILFLHQTLQCMESSSLVSPPTDQKRVQRESTANVSPTAAAAHNAVHR